MNSHTLRQQLALIADIQAALDALRLDVSLRLKESPPCTDVTATAAMEATGISPRSGWLSAS